MASYEEIMEEMGEDTRTVETGGFKFPTHSPTEKAARQKQRESAPGPVATAPMRDVLGNWPTSGPGLRRIAPLVYEQHSEQERILEAAVAAVKEIRLTGKAVVGYDPDNPEPFFDACADTARTAQEVEQTIADAAEASIAAEIFKLAGFYSGRIHLLTDRAKVQTQMLVMEKARQVKYMFARQAELEMQQRQ